MLKCSQKTFLALKGELQFQGSEWLICPVCTNQMKVGKESAFTSLGRYVLLAFSPNQTLFSSKQSAHHCINILHFRHLYSLVIISLPVRETWTIVSSLIFLSCHIWSGSNAYWFALLAYKLSKTHTIAFWEMGFICWLAQEK